MKKNLELNLGLGLEESSEDDEEEHTTAVIPTKSRKKMTFMAPLQAACVFGRADIVSLLLEAGADPFMFDAPTGHTCTALYYAVARGHIDVVRAIIEHARRVDDAEGCAAAAASSHGTVVMKGMSPSDAAKWVEWLRDEAISETGGTSDGPLRRRWQTTIREADGDGGEGGYSLAIADSATRIAVTTAAPSEGFGNLFFFRLSLRYKRSSPSSVYVVTTC